MKLAVLSNANIDMVYRMLPSGDEIFQPQGYGNAFSLLLDKNSSLARFSPTVIFFIVDITALTEASFTYEAAIADIDEWFFNFRACINPMINYYISDVITRSDFIEDTDDLTGSRLEAYWLDKLRKLMEEYLNIHSFPLSRLVKEKGKSAFFSEQLWYMGKVPFSAAGCKLIAQQIMLQLKQAERTPKKVLVLDLDNTLWGGIVGELGLEGIQLSDDKIGAIYRNSQRMIKQMQSHGVILAINSKNNPKDALEVINKHPHMVLREEDFAVMKINWDAKPMNMQAIAKELNLGLDSFVFIDDMPAERESMRSLLPMVEVPEFPKAVDMLPGFFREIYCSYFMKNRMTAEDLQKTRQYRENAQRNELEASLDYNSFLKTLNIQIERVTYDNAVKERLAQLLQKTNQFNLTTRRHTLEDLSLFEQNGWLIYMFRASDKFGDYGTIAALLVDPSGETPRIDSFVMSCRVMGKLVENFIIDYVEKDLFKKGYHKLIAEYIPTEKNIPVKDLYDNLGYQRLSADITGQRYEIALNCRPKRSYFILNK
jgi:FkbH-like protein